MTRKPISLTVATNGCLYAICDDGTIWFRAPPRTDWVRIEGIPQEGAAQ